VRKQIKSFSAQNQKFYISAPRHRIWTFFNIFWHHFSREIQWAHSGGDRMTFGLRHSAHAL
jgi:hypothetical protein